MTKITLNNVANLQNENSAVSTINNNNATLVTAIDNTISRDGTVPNTMNADFDMNSNRVLNLPAPVSAVEPLRLADLNTFIGGGTITSIPSGGTTGQALTKLSNTNYNIGWVTVPTNLTAGSNISVTGSNPSTIAVISSPSFTTPNINVATGTDLTLSSLGTSSSVQTDSAKKLVTIVNTGTGSNVLATAPRIVVPDIVGTNTNNNAVAGSVGEYVFQTISSGAPVALTTVTPTNIASISLTAGDWDVTINPGFIAATTTVNLYHQASLSATSATLDTSTSNFSSISYGTAGLATGSSGANQIMIPPIVQRLSLTATTTYYFVARCSFNTSTLSGFGIIQARRIR